MIYTRIGPAIIKVSNIMDDIIFTPISLRKYANNKERKYGNIDQYYYYVNDGYIYIPDINIEAINVDLITLDRKAALELGGCGTKKMIHVYLNGIMISYALISYWNMWYLRR